MHRGNKIKTIITNKDLITKMEVKLIRTHSVVQEKSRPHTPDNSLLNPHLKKSINTHPISQARSSKPLLLPSFTLISKGDQELPL